MPATSFPQFDKEYDFYKMRALVDALERKFNEINAPGETAGGGSGGTSIHNNLSGRAEQDSHPIGAITSLRAELDALDADIDATALVASQNTAAISSLTARVDGHDIDLAQARLMRYFLGE